MLVCLFEGSCCFGSIFSALNFWKVPKDSRLRVHGRGPWFGVENLVGNGVGTMGPAWLGQDPAEGTPIHGQDIAAPTRKDFIGLPKAKP